MRNSSSVAILLLVLSGTAVAQESEPRTADDYIDRGIVRYNSGDLDGALADFTQAVALDPSHPGAYGNRGYAREDKGDADGAIADYSKAISLDPTVPFPYALRATLKMKNGDIDGALTDYTRSIALDPTDATVFAARGVMRQVKGELDGAIDDFRKTIALDSNNIAARKSLALIMATASRTELRDGRQAVAHARRVGTIENWQDPFTLEILALAYAESGDFRQAAEWQAKALEFPDYRNRAGEKARQRLESYRQQMQKKAR